MGKQGLIDILNELLIPIGFKRKGNYWLLNGNIITKMVNLQKSQFSDRFYINYGYILQELPLNNLSMHIFKGLGSVDVAENNRIKELLALENNISDEIRTIELKQFISDKLISNIQDIKTKEDLSRDLKKRTHLNDVPLFVKNYLGLE